MKLDDWNRIVNATGDSNPNAIAYRAPRDALQLFCFSRHVMEWVPKGDWWLLQLDNSTPVDPNTASLLSAFLTHDPRRLDFSRNRTFLIESGDAEDGDAGTELRLSNLIFTLLLLEHHAYLVSSNSLDGQMLSLQDGLAYLQTREQNQLKARMLLADFERNPMGNPKWLNEVVARYQDGDQP